MADDGMAVLLTTHLLEEADKADRVAIMSDGKIIAEGSPHELAERNGRRHGHRRGQRRRSASSDCCETISGSILNAFSINFVCKAIHLERLSPSWSRSLGDEAQSIAIGRPSLEDVFIAKTGHEFAT